MIKDFYSISDRLFGILKIEILILDFSGKFLTSFVLIMEK